MKRIKQSRLDGVKKVTEMISCARLEAEDGPLDAGFIIRAEIAVKFLLVIKGGDLSREDLLKLMFELKSQGYEEESIKKTLKGLAFLARLTRVSNKRESRKSRSS